MALLADPNPSLAGGLEDLAETKVLASEENHETAYVGLAADETMEHCVFYLNCYEVY